MLVKEFMTLSTGILIALFITNPLHFREAVHKLQYRILREATRTDNWGAPFVPAPAKTAKSPGHQSL